MHEVEGVENVATLSIGHYQGVAHQLSQRVTLIEVVETVARRDGRVPAVPRTNKEINDERC